MNKGEQNELLMNLSLIYFRDTKQNGIESVSYAGKECGTFQTNNYDLLSELSDSELTILANKIGCGKSPSGAKSDIYINGIGTSLKYTNAAAPAIVNHTSRPGFERVCSVVNRDIEELDEIISDYHKLRSAGIISEDTKNKDKNCPFVTHKEYLRPIIEYFLFTGTGSKESNYPAEQVLEFSDPFNISTWKYLSLTEAFDTIWDNLVFSLRSKKGMPVNYKKETYKGKNAISISKWTEIHNNEYKGALHIRVTK